jgi:hypothetical protein
MTTTRGGREREREERTKKKRRRRRRRKTALSSEEEGETSSDDEEEEEEEDEEEELENRTRKGGRGRGKLPSKETIRNAFEELCRGGEEAGKKEGEEEDGFTLQNLLDLCAKYGYHDWTLAEIENMLDAYDLSEARGEKKISDPETVLVTESGFLEIVRKCGVREL